MEYWFALLGHYARLVNQEALLVHWSPQIIEESAIDHVLHAGCGVVVLLEVLEVAKAGKRVEVEAFKKKRRWQCVGVQKSPEERAAVVN